MEKPAGRGGFCPISVRWQRRNAIIVREPENGLETLRRQADGLHDVRSLDVELGLYLRSLPDVDVAGRTALAHMLPPMIMPTLTLNLEASQQRDAVIQRAVKPVLHRVQRGRGGCPGRRYRQR